MLFIRSAAENLPNELTGIANEIHISFPWGSLLKFVIEGEGKFLRSLRSTSAPGAVLKLVLGIDPKRDVNELGRLGISDLAVRDLARTLVPVYVAAGFDLLEIRELSKLERREFPSSWARRLIMSEERTVLTFVFRAK